MSKINILWVDDEIDLLKLHILFLEEKGYQLMTANNGDDAISLVHENNFDIIFLDENMPGLSGLETLEIIKGIYPSIPIIMITKSEEEDIMDKAIGSKISDYLIKPVNPNQILLAIKKNVDTKRLVSEKTTSDYRAEFGSLGSLIGQASSFKDWVDIYKKLIFWELELEKSGDKAMDDVLLLQKEEANFAFVKYIKNNYLNWFDEKSDDRPLLPIDIFKQKIFPKLGTENRVLIVIDNLRYDQWKTIEPLIKHYYQIESETICSSILPTATNYARNALFAGMMPSQIEKQYPEYWISDEEENSKNQYEKELLQNLMKKMRLDYRLYYEKVFNNKAGEKLLDNISLITENQLSVIVYNFIDMISHARTELELIRELAYDEKAYRSLTLTWFEHSSLFELIKILGSKKVKLSITTDHGTIRVANPLKVIGERNTTTNLRYKQGKNLTYNPKEVYEISDPKKLFLPMPFISSKYIFATNKDFFAYPNNYNHYVKYYKDTFQHGGISLEEMLIPYIDLNPKP
jgi:CheY-like chemotaxis protein